jgi:hypothetical protein
MFILENLENIKEITAILKTGLRIDQNNPNLLRLYLILRVFKAITLIISKSFFNFLIFFIIILNELRLYFR